MKKHLLLIALISTSSFALTLDEAISKALENNNNYKKQSYILEEKQANYDLTTSAYHPKLDLSYNYVANKEAISTQKDYSSASAIISYNLFNGFADKYNIQSAQLQEKSMQHTLNAAKFDLIFNTKQLYIQYLSNKKLVDTMKLAYDLYNQQYSDALHKYDQGLLSKNDLLHINTQLLQAQQNLQQAQSNSVINRLQLQNFMGVTLNKDEVIEDISQNTISLEEFDQTLLDNRSELLAMQEQLSSIEATKKANDGNYYPKINTQVSYTKFGDNAQLDVSPEAFEDQQTATINLSWNLYNGFKDQSQEKILLSKKKQLNADFDDLKLSIKLQYETAMQQYNVAKLNLETATIALEQADENYKIVNNRFQEGLSSATDLLDANYLLSQAKQNFDNAYYNKYLSYASLQRIFEK